MKDYAEAKEKQLVCGIYDLYPQASSVIDGGLRKKGIIKTDKEELPLITYITVVYNRKSTLLRCMESIWNQSYENIEYIIIDGASTDGTLELIKENEDKIDYFISQKDTGIYNAMNKGLSLARGRYICFMNSDDECSADAARIFYDKWSTEKANIYCGRRFIRTGDLISQEFLYPRYPIKYGYFIYMQMYHQSTYAHKDVFNNIGGFCEKYRLISDWKWQAEAISAGYKVFFFDEVLSIFSVGGVSSGESDREDKEWVDWLCESFEWMTSKDAEMLLFSMDIGRNPLYSIKTLNGFAQEHQDDTRFAKAYYEVGLLGCIHLALKMESYYGIDNKLLKHMDQKGNFPATKQKYTSVYEVKMLAEEMLEQSLSADKESIDYDMLKALANMKKFINDTVVSLMRKRLIKAIVTLDVNDMAKSVYYVWSYSFSKTKLGSRLFCKLSRKLIGLVYGK